MNGEVRARSEAGRDATAVVEALGPALAARAAEADRDGRFPHASLDDLRAHRHLALAVPAEAGGLGVESVHDLLVVASRLARFDPALAIGVNMHHVSVLALARAWRSAAGDRAPLLLAVLEGLASSGQAIAAAVSEPPPQDLSRPTTRARREGDGWVLDGAKAFCTLSPAADWLNVALTFTDDAGRERYGFALVPTSLPGVTVHDDWDALGMRASGSGRVTFDAVALPGYAVNDSHPAGTTSPVLLDRFLTSGAFHAAATLGIAEAAHHHVVDDPRRRERLLADPQSVLQVGESTAELAAARAVLAAAADAVDAHLATERPEDPEAALALAGEAFARVQQAKAMVERLGQAVVDRSLALTGGAGYLTASPLSRAYRDVRAGAFMHPLGANRAHRFLGEVALGRVPAMA